MNISQPTSRRDFFTQAAALLSASMFTARQATAATEKKYKMGLQLFTVRGPMRIDAAGTLKTVSGIGYEDLETYGFEPAQAKYYGMPAADFKKLLEDNKLSTTSGHYDLFRFLDRPDDDLNRYVDQCITGAEALGQRYITWPWLDPDSRTLEKFRLLTGRLNLIGERVSKAGLGFAYHNHDFEFTDQGGENGYELIMRETDPSLVKLQIDLYWAAYASRQTPHELFTRQPGRFVMWHIKDMDKTTRDYTELGNGSIDYKVILPDAPLAGLQYYFLEQGGNFARDPITSITDSAAFMKQQLAQYLR
jgi:sugar phosphate isomerase/epimerase